MVPENSKLITIRITAVTDTRGSTQGYNRGNVRTCLPMPTGGRWHDNDDMMRHRDHGRDAREPADEASPFCLYIYIYIGSAVGSQTLAVGPQGHPPGAAAVQVAVILAGHLAVVVEAERVVVVLLPAARGFFTGGSHHPACKRNETG
jgi:hypothetical protein